MEYDAGVGFQLSPRSDLGPTDGIKYEIISWWIRLQQVIMEVCQNMMSDSKNSKKKKQRKSHFKTLWFFSGTYSDMHGPYTSSLRWHNCHVTVWYQQFPRICLHVYTDTIVT